MKILERPQVAARRCLGRLLTKKPHLCESAPIGKLMAKHLKVKRAGHWRVTTQDWEGVLAEVLYTDVTANPPER